MGSDKNNFTVLIPLQKHEKTQIIQLKSLEYAEEVPQARRFNSFGHRHIEKFLWSKLLKLLPPVVLISSIMTVSIALFGFKQAFSQAKAGGYQFWGFCS